jgi:hypothetical protein
MEEPMRYETATMWRYYIGAIKVLVPAGTTIVMSDDWKTFSFKGYLGAFDSDAIPKLLKTGDLRIVPERAAGSK